MDYKNEIRDFLRNRGVDLFGVADICNLKDEPPGYRPDEILPGAKSVIVFGRKVLDGTVQALIEGIEEKSATKQNVYGAFGYELTPNFALTFDAFYLAQYLERKYDVICTPLPGDLLQGGFAMDTGHAAVAAGLGELAWNGHVVTEQYGPRVSFSAVITTMELPADEPRRGERLCDPSKCKICVQKCPVGAISDYDSGKETTYIIGGENYSVAQIEDTPCMVASYGLRKEFGGEADRVASLWPDEAEMDAAFRSMSTNDSAHLSHFPEWKCKKCFAYCPLGNWSDHFKSAIS